MTRWFTSCGATGVLAFGQADNQMYIATWLLSRQSGNRAFGPPLTVIRQERIAALTHSPKAGILHYWRSRLSLTLQILLAQAVRERFALAQVPTYSGGADESRRIDFFSISTVC